MKIAFLKSKSSSHGGLEKYAARLTSAFSERGDAVTVLSEQKSFWPSFLRLEQYDRYVQKWVRNHQPDVIFGMERNRYQTHIRAGNGVHAAYLKTRAPSWNPLHKKILEIEKTGFEYEGLRKIFTNSYMVRNQILEYYSVDPAKIEVVHNGVEWYEMQTDFDHWQPKETNRPHFLFVGHGYERKGLDLLLDALSQYKSDFLLTVIGKDKHIDRYKAKAAKIKDKVFFLGPQPNIRPFYQLADVLVLPTAYDPFANVTIEALAMGLFAITTKTNGAHEILTPQNGAIIENNIDSLLSALSSAPQKTKITAEKIRNSVQHLDFSTQLAKIIHAI